MVIVVAEGPTAAGKTSWCRACYPHSTVPEAASIRELEQSLGECARRALWLEGNCRRWRQALEMEQRDGLAVCDTDPCKLHYTWSLWRVGELAEDEWQLSVELTGEAFAEGRLGLTDLILVQIPPAEELRRRRERDRAETGRRRGSFELHHELGAPLREWYESVERLEPGRVRWSFPTAGRLQPLPPPRAGRSGLHLFEALLAELPT